MEISDAGQPIAAGRPVTERDVLVPLIDETRDGIIYDPSLSLFSVGGAIIGAVVGGWLGWSLSVGAIAVTGFGQWAASGGAVGTFTGGGVGAATIGLLGALIALYRLPARASMHERSDEGSIHE